MVLSLVGLLALSGSTASELYGLVRVKNSAACSGAPSGCTALVDVDPVTGTLHRVGVAESAVTTLAAVGDLAAIDRAARVYYFLGDGDGNTTHGTQLVGLSLDTGGMVCAAPVPEIATLGLVGGGQTLSIDPGRRRLLLSGIAPDESNPHHVVLTAALPGCGPFVVVGDGFGDARFEPMAHGSVFDPSTATLFITVSTGPHTYGLLNVNTTTGSAIRAAIPMAREHSLWGPVLGVGGRLAGVAMAMAGDSVDWRTVDPRKPTGAWTSRPLRFSESGSRLDNLWGNLGSVRAVNPGSGSLFVLMARGQSEKLQLAEVNVTTGTVLGSPPYLNGFLGSSTEVLMSMAFA